MTGNSDFPVKTAPASGSEDVDAEHGIQLGLLEAALTALTEGAPAAAELVDQLYGYTQAHFMSEQLLMRLSARPNYDGHLEDHERLMQELDAVKDRMNAEPSGAAALLKSHEKHLLAHIRSWDRSIDHPGA